MTPLKRWLCVFRILVAIQAYGKTEPFIQLVANAGLSGFKHYQIVFRI